MEIKYHHFNEEFKNCFSPSSHSRCCALCTFLDNILRWQISCSLLVYYVKKGKRNEEKFVVFIMAVAEFGNSIQFLFSYKNTKHGSRNSMESAGREVISFMQMQMFVKEINRNTSRRASSQKVKTTWARLVQFRSPFHTKLHCPPKLLCDEIRNWIYLDLT